MLGWKKWKKIENQIAKNIHNLGSHFINKMNIYALQQEKEKIMHKLFALIWKNRFTKFQQILNESENELINETDCTGEQLIIFAITDDKPVFVDFLLQNGAIIDKYVINRINSKLLDHVSHGNILKVKALMKYQEKFPFITDAIANKSIFKARSIEMADYLLQNGANINAIRDDEENTIAHTFWSSQVSLEFCEFLLQVENPKCINLSVKNRNGLTAAEYCETLLISDVKPKLIRSYDKIRNERIMFLMIGYEFDEGSLVHRDYIGKDMFLLITQYV